MSLILDLVRLHHGVQTPAAVKLKFKKRPPPQAVCEDCCGKTPCLPAAAAIDGELCGLGLGEKAASASSMKMKLIHPA